MNNADASFVQRILEDDNINEAINYLLSKGDKPGPDGMKPSMLIEYWKDNKESIIESIFNCQYEAGIASQ